MSLLWTEKVGRQARARVSQLALGDTAEQRQTGPGRGAGRGREQEASPFTSSAHASSNPRPVSRAQETIVKTNGESSVRVTRAEGAGTPRTLTWATEPGDR